jgi:hypothetical protein
MKKATSLSLALVSALLIGCGGGSSGGDATPTDETGSNTSTGTTGSTTSTSGTPIEGSTFTITGVDSVKGYTITSNESTLNVGGQYTAHQRISISFKCDGTFEYTIVTSASGVSSTSYTTGDQVDFDGSEISWSGTDNEGETMNDSLTINANNQLVLGSTCWSDFGGDNEAGAECPNNIYVESVTQNATCN